MRLMALSEVKMVVGSVRSQRKAQDREAVLELSAPGRETCPSDRDAYIGLRNTRSAQGRYSKKALVSKDCRKGQRVALVTPR